MITNWVNGEAREAANAATFETIDPWTQEPHNMVVLSSRSDVDAAVTAARTAFDEGPWARMSYTERGALMHRLADLIEANADELAAADSADMGKPLKAMLSKDVPRAAQNVRFFADHARLTPSEMYPTEGGITPTPATNQLV